MQSYPLLKEVQGVTLIITAQAEAEMISDVRNQCAKNGMKHFWIDLRGANQALMTSKSTLTYLRQRVSKLFGILSTNKERAVLHCAAGVHRTGTIGYTLLRMHGQLSGEEAYEALGKMRQETRKGVGDWRIKLAEEHLV